MRKNLTEIVFILDRSGSMSGLEADTIGGFNSMIEKQKKENGEALISTVLFDNVSEVIHDRVPVQRVEPMTDRDYSVRWKMQSVWITSSTLYRLQIWFCRIRIPPLRNTPRLNCCQYPS